jgi:DNA polymerase-1
MPRTLLIDGDILFYRAASASQGSVEFDPGVETVWADEAGAIRIFEQTVSALLRKSNFAAYFVCLSDHNLSFRKQMATFYKAHRNGIDKPKLLGVVEQHAIYNHPTLAYPRLEADDVLGIHATSGKHQNPVIVSADKDLRQIPGEHLVEGKIKVITAAEGHLWHMTQTLIGDPTDGYKGCPDIGPKKASLILAEEPHWPAIVNAYASKDLTEADALLQARLARILQHGDYRPSDSKIKLWTPPA